MRSMNKKLIAAVVTSAALGLMASTASAVQQGDWILRFGLSNVSPNDSSGGFSGNPAIGAAVDGDTQPSVNLTYMLKDNIGIEVLAALPFRHDINATGAVTGKVADTRQLPPTVSLQYHFKPGASVRPYVGLGLNYTTFFDINTTGALAGTSLELDDSFGLAAQAGVDMDINDKWFFNADVRYIDIDTTATSSALGTVDVSIDPWVFTLGVGTTF